MQITATLHMEADSRGARTVDTGITHKIDATSAILGMTHSLLLQLRDNSKLSGTLAEEKIAELGHTGPYRVSVEEAVEAFSNCCFEQSKSEISEEEWDKFRNLHLPTSCDQHLRTLFQGQRDKLENEIEDYFSKLAILSDTAQDEIYDDDTHDSFYTAAVEVISQGIRSQLEFLRDNAPGSYKYFLKEAGIRLILPSKNDQQSLLLNLRHHAKEMAYFIVSHYNSSISNEEIESIRSDPSHPLNHARKTLELLIGKASYRLPEIVSKS